MKRRPCTAASWRSGSLPVAGLPSSDGAAGPLAPPEELSDLLRGQERRAQDQAAARRTTPDEPATGSELGEQAGIDLVGHCDGAFRGRSRKFGGRGAGCGRGSGESSSISSRSLGGRDVRGRQHQRGVRRPPDVDVVAGGAARQILLRSDMGEHRGTVGRASDSRSTGPRKVRSTTLADTDAASTGGCSIDTRTRSGRDHQRRPPPGSMVVSPGGL